MTTWRTLTEELDELERTDPAVRAAADRYQETIRQILSAASSEPSRARLRWETPWLTPAEEADSLGQEMYEREVRGG